MIASRIHSEHIMYQEVTGTMKKLANRILFQSDGMGRAILRRSNGSMDHQEVRAGTMGMSGKNIRAEVQMP